MQSQQTAIPQDSISRHGEQLGSTIPLRTMPTTTPTIVSASIQRGPFTSSSAASIAPTVVRSNPSQELPASQPTVEEVSFVEPPNGGLDAYLKVFGGFCVFFITLGVASTFGSYQAYYEADLLSSRSSSAISWIGTTQVFLLSFVGMFSGAFYDRGHLKLVLGTGLSLVVLGLMLLSVSRSYWQILLTQGICVGFGSGLLYVPAVAVVSNQFTTKRAVALGVAATGTAVGGVVLPITFRQLLPSIDFGWTNRALGFLVLLLSVLAYLLLTDIHCCLPCRSNHRRQRSHPSSNHNRRQTTASAAPLTGATKRDRIVSLYTALHGRAYLFLCMGVFFVFLGYWVPLFYIVPFATLSLGTSPAQASYLLAILNAGSFFGRTVPAYLSQIVGTALVLFVGATSLGVIVFAWLGIGNLAGITVWCFLVGYVLMALSQPLPIGTGHAWYLSHSMMI